MQSKSSRLIIFAVNVSQGGGGYLLTELLESIPKSFNSCAVLDARMHYSTEVGNNIQIISAKPNIFSRLIAQIWLFWNVKKTDLVLCFGSLPPLFRLHGRCVVFIQNRILVEKKQFLGFPIKTMFRLYVERMRLRLSSANGDAYIVQTATMRDILMSSGIVNKSTPIYIRPIGLNHVESKKICLRESSNPHGMVVEYDFLYPASGDPHKNHVALIEAWCILANEKIFPSLCLTLSEVKDLKLLKWIKSRQLDYQLNIKNVGFIEGNDMPSLYSQSHALIYPSKIESFGLPLIEASHANIPTLASELDYVRDLVDPVQTFDPDSPISIARAVKRFIGVDERRPKLLDGSEFLNLLFRDLP